MVSIYRQGVPTIFAAPPTSLYSKLQKAMHNKPPEILPTFDQAMEKVLHPKDSQKYIFFGMDNDIQIAKAGYCGLATYSDKTSQQAFWITMYTRLNLSLSLSLIPVASHLLPVEMYRIYRKYLPEKRCPVSRVSEAQAQPITLSQIQTTF